MPVEMANNEWKLARDSVMIVEHTIDMEDDEQKGVDM